MPPPRPLRWLVRCNTGGGSITGRRTLTAEEKSEAVKQERSRLLAIDPKAIVSNIVCDDETDENGKPTFNTTLKFAGGEQPQPKDFDPRKR